MLSDFLLESLNPKAKSHSSGVAPSCNQSENDGEIHVSTLKKLSVKMPCFSLPLQVSLAEELPQGRLQTPCRWAGWAAGLGDFRPAEAKRPYLLVTPHVGSWPLSAPGENRWSLGLEAFFGEW